jgi:hypothetical protein
MVETGWPVPSTASGGGSRSPAYTPCGLGPQNTTQVHTTITIVKNRSLLILTSFTNLLWIWLIQFLRKTKKPPKGINPMEAFIKHLLDKYGHGFLQQDILIFRL